MEFSTVYKVLSPRLSEYQAVAEYLQRRPSEYAIIESNYASVDSFLHSASYLKGSHTLPRLDKSLLQLCKRAVEQGDETFVLTVAVNLSPEADQKLLLEHLFRVHQRYFRIPSLIRDFIVKYQQKIGDPRDIALGLYAIGDIAQFQTFSPQAPNSHWDSDNWTFARSVLLKIIAFREMSENELYDITNNENIDPDTFVSATLQLLALHGAGEFLANCRTGPLLGTLSASDTEQACQQPVSAKDDIAPTRLMERAATLLQHFRDGPEICRTLLTIVLTLVTRAQTTNTFAELLAIPGTAELACVFQFIIGLEVLADGAQTQDDHKLLTTFLAIISESDLRRGTLETNLEERDAKESKLFQTLVLAQKLALESNQSSEEDNQTLTACGYLLKCYQEACKNSFFCRRRVREVASAYLGQALTVEVGLPPLADMCLCLVEIL